METGSAPLASSADLIAALSTGFAPRLSLFSLAAPMLVGSALALLLRAHFVALATQTTGDRRAFGNNLVLVTLATTLIILTIKSSLALSLGLVGALSIVRFRTPIKEPEELVYLFLAVGLGVGMGAEVILETGAAFLFILLVSGILFLLQRRRRQCVGLSLLEVGGIETDGASLLSHLRESSLRAELVRVSAAEGTHWVFGLREATQEQLLAAVSRLRTAYPGARVSLHRGSPS